MSSNVATIEKPEDLSGVELWNAEITAAEQELKKFYERGRKVTKKFLDERDAINTTAKFFNVFYANTNILESALYAQLPRPVVNRKYQDFQDDVGRVAALIIERNITQDLDDPNDTFDAMMRHCVQDRLVPGLSQAWLRLETDTEEISVPPTPGNDTEGPDDLAENAPMLQRITDQRVAVDYIFWQDFLWSPCRVWEENRWVARKAYMTRDELIERFGEEKGKACPLNFVATVVGDNIQSSTPKEDVLKKAIVYEIWDRTTRKIIWYVKGYDALMDEKDDFLGLSGFYPCPRPMLANVSTSNSVPRPDYYMIQDQYSELDTVNNRISMLVQACKVVGVYDKAATGISRMLTEGYDNQLIPVDNWAMFAEKGGLKGQVDWLPLEAITTALRELNAAREVIKGQIYELTGIADIVRGASKASETLGAQQIKAQFASVRIKKLQDEVARFARDVMRIKAEIMVKHFDPQILVTRSNLMDSDNAQYVAPAMQLLKSQEGFEWRIQINADTLAQADYAMQKQDRIEIMTAMSKFMAQMTPMLAQEPGSAPLLLTLMKWTLAGFQGAHEIEGMLDKELDRLAAMAKQPQQPKPDPEAMKAQAEMQAMQQAHQMDMQAKQADMQADQQKNAMEAQAQQQELKFEQQRLMLEFAMEKQRLDMEMNAEKQRLAMETHMEELKLRMEMAMGHIKLQNAQDMGDAKVENTKAMTAAKPKTEGAK